MFQLSLFVIFLLIPYGSAVSINEIKTSFELFKTRYNIVYGEPEEETRRFAVFAHNYATIKAHNALVDSGDNKARLGITKFADLTQEEFVAKYLNMKPPASNDAPEVHKKMPKSELPSSLDWRDKQVVTGVKDQGSCGSCWAFAAVAAIESAHCIKTKDIVSLSEQQLVDCDNRTEDHGCSGGYMTDAYEYIILNKGIDHTGAYPYVGHDDKCAFDSTRIGATLSSYANVTSGDEDALLSAVAQQPISVAIDATYLHLYKSGIIASDSPCKSDVESLNHGITIMGYGTENSTDFWTLKNSWGWDFGEDGYFRLERGKNVCGVATLASYPII